MRDHGRYQRLSRGVPAKRGRFKAHLPWENGAGILGPLIFLLLPALGSDLVPSVSGESVMLSVGLGVNPLDDSSALMALGRGEAEVGPTRLHPGGLRILRKIASQLPYPESAGPSQAGDYRCQGKSNSILKVLTWALYRLA